MQLLSIRLQGQYKGLKNQTFSFDDSEGNIIAFIGLNGSGKSQLLELVAETFGYLERYLRDDFKCRNWFDSLELDLLYYNEPYNSEKNSDLYSININRRGKVNIHRNGDTIDLNSSTKQGIEEQILPSHIIGYSSGMNENLQRSFMKNSIQYLDVMNVKKSWEIRLEKIKKIRDDKGKHLTESDLELFDRQFLDAYQYYQNRHPAVFNDLPDNTNIADNSNIGLRATALPRLKYLDHDTTALMLVSIGLMEDTEQKNIWQNKQRFKKVNSAWVKYDLRKFKHDAGALLDIAKIIECVGGINSENFTPLPNIKKTSEDFYNQFELDYLAGEIYLDFSKIKMQKKIAETFFEPINLFEKLYRLQLLASDYWLGETKRQLRKDNFARTTKKPQKWKSPIQVTSLKLTDGVQCIEFEDLSDGEAQLIQVLSMAALFKEARTLFLLDEPETHLNPLWRTYFHSYLEEITGSNNEKLHFFISTHSPFMISSLKRNNVYQFNRRTNNLITMSAVQNETYGASFDVLVKDLFELRSLISQSVIDEIREQLKKSDIHAKTWIEENLGLSAERAYLIRKLS